MIETGLITGDAGIDGVGLARLRFADKRGIGKKWPRHRHHVGNTVAHNLFRHLGMINTVGSDNRYADVLAQMLRDPGETGTRHAGGNGGNAGFMPANAAVEQRHAALLQRRGKLQRLLQRAAVIHQVEHRQAKNNNKGITDGGAHRLRHFQCKALPPRHITAPAVVALIGMGDQELINQVAFGTHDFDTVVTGLLRQPGAAREIRDGLFNLRFAQCLRCKRVNGRL